TITSTRSPASACSSQRRSDGRGRRLERQLLLVGDLRHVDGVREAADGAFAHVQQEVVDGRAVQPLAWPDPGVVEREHADDVDLAVDLLVPPALGRMEVL